MEWLLTSDWQYVVIGMLIAVVTWFSKQGWNLLTASVGSYKQGITDRVDANERRQDELRKEFRGLENTLVQMMDEEEAARREDIARVEDKLTGMVKGMRSDLSTVDKKIDGIKDQIIEILRPS